MLTWGHDGFPEEYAGEAYVMYGHHNDPTSTPTAGRGRASSGATIGLDTIAHGVLTAVALPGPQVFQSTRYAPAIRVRG